MKTVLFQGDSITDTGRSRENDNNRGFGYATLLSSHLMYAFPGEYTTYNRGISGNRVVDLYARIKADFINLKPDVISILIGVNDVWHELERQNGVDADRFYDVYCMLIEDLRKALPDVQILILEPFALEGSATDRWWDEFRQEVDKRADKARKVAEKYDLPFVALQDKFDEAAKLASNDYWLRDGVHPTPAGHELIKQEWLKVYSAL